VLQGECVALIEGEKRPLRAWDFAHCPAGTEHIFVGAGDGRCRTHGRHTVETETAESYARMPAWRDGPPPRTPLNPKSRLSGRLL
jgi:uncharacterized cupin superfamily protein